MSRRTLPLLASAALLAAGCQERPADPPSNAPLNAEAPRPDTIPPPSEQPPAAGESPGFSSVYTSIAPANCTVISRSEEGASVSYRCDGHAGVAVFVSDGDGRMDVDAGVPNDTWTSPGNGAFNSVGETMEWRLRNGTPVAAIVRYAIEGGPEGDPPPRSELAVLKIGRTGAPGCVVAWVPASAAPSQNEAARRIAETQADAFSCDASR